MSTPAPPRCDATRITAYVDGALPAEDGAAVEAHIAVCPSCRDQEAFERGLRERMRALPTPEMGPLLERRVRRELRRQTVPAAVRWLPLVAGLALTILWGRGAAPFVAWELARDHAHCFERQTLTSQVWTSDSIEIADWYRQHGTELPVTPSAAGGVSLVGGRFCPLLDRKVAHLYYSGEKRHLSVFVVPGPARFASGFSTRTRGENVRLVPTNGGPLGLVGEDAETVEAFQRALSMSRADGSAAIFPPDPPAPGLGGKERQEEDEARSVAARQRHSTDRFLVSRLSVATARRVRADLTVPTTIRDILKLAVGTRLVVDAIDAFVR